VVTVNVDNLHRSFGRVKAVDGVSFEFVSGEVHGFIGPNGAGKTTTMRIISTLEEPDEGDVTLDGTSIIDYPEKAREVIGFMPDYIESYKDMLVEEYLDFYARAYKLHPRRRRLRLDDVTDFCDLKDLLDRPVHGLSKGMKQRLSLGRVLINDPKALILDEPAAGLDPRARIELRRLIRLLADRGKAVFISSHILSELSEICDSVTIIEHGTVHASSSVQAIQETIDQGTRVEVHILGEEETEHIRLATFLKGYEGVEQVEKLPSGAAFSYEGDSDFRVALLKQLIAAEFQLTDFHAATSDLEDAFMSLTQGVVQ
jgi:ABC-2 type transport system ATP-binding protein